MYKCIKTAVDTFKILSIIRYKEKPAMKDKAKIIRFLKQYFVITSGCVVFALGVSLFLDANNIASGGVTGIAIIVNYLIGDLTGLHTGVWIIIINVPLFITGAVFFGRNFILSTVYSTVVSSLFVELFNFCLERFLPVTTNMLIASVLGGALFGIGLGLIFRMGSTTGGTDIIVKILRKKFRYIRTGMISMGIDILIVAASAFVYRNFELTCYTILSIVVMALLFDWVLYGGNSAKLVYIITTEEKSEAMCKKILNELDLGATFIDGKGAYSGKDKRIVMCAIKNTMYPRLHDVVREVDPNAFTIVTSAKEIYGEGYKNPTDDEL